VAGKHLVQDCTEGEDVRTDVHLPALQLLWRHIAGGAEKFPRLCGLGRYGCYSLEGLCHEYWRQDAHGFQAFVERECPVVAVFLESFRREATEVAAGDRGTL
jgi:hypothetical protein